MKKYGLLIMLVLCVVVGGVYATWSYAQAPVGDATDSMGVTLEAKTVEAAAGTINVDSNNLAITIVNAGGYKPSVSVSGSMVVSFAPATGADAGVVSNGIKLQFAVEGPQECQYNMTDIFKVTTAPQELNGGSPTKSVTIQSTDIEKLISCNDFTLDTAEKHEGFDQALQGKTFKIVISEVA